MKTIAYSSPYVPAEWIEAHGLQSRRLRPLATDGSRLHATTRGVCPYAAVLVANAVSQDAIILTTVCDQMRYAASLLTLQNRVPVFLLNVPSTWQTSAARQLYRAELQRLGRFLTTLGGTAPTDSELTSKMLAHVPLHNCEAGQANRCHDESSLAAGCHRPVHTRNENQQDNVPVAVVGILCEYTPRELIMAAGGVPVCLCGGSAQTIPAAEQHLPANLCPLIKSTYGYHVLGTNPFLEMADLVPCTLR